MSRTTNGRLVVTISLVFSPLPIYCGWGYRSVWRSSGHWLTLSIPGAIQIFSHRCHHLTAGCWSGKNLTFRSTD